MEKLISNLLVLASVYFAVKALLAALRIYSESRKTYYHALIFNLKKNFFEREIAFELRELHKLTQSYWGQNNYQKLVKVFNKNEMAELIQNWPKQLDHKLYVVNMIGLYNFLHASLDYKNVEEKETLKYASRSFKEILTFLFKCGSFEIKHLGYNGQNVIIVDDFGHFFINLDDLPLQLQLHVLRQSNLIKKVEIITKDKQNFINEIKSLFQKKIEYFIKKGLIKNPSAVFKIRMIQ
jgi:hypothetical protein